MAALAAIDLGASSGRVMLGNVGRDRLELSEVNRFPNSPVRIAGTLYWDILGLHRGVLDGLRAAGQKAGQLSSIGIDAWAVDYGLIGADGALVGNPVHYRDARTDGVMDKMLSEVGPQELYDITGLQQLPFNTIYQLVAASGSAALESASTVLLIPDLISYWLTGEIGAEATNASTTQLYDVRRRCWSDPLIDGLGLSRGLFPPLRRSGDSAGILSPDALSDTGLRGPVPVTAVGSHDTASAVVGVPAANERFAYVSCGTWSLVGLELDRPVLTEDSRRANFTNEEGVDGTTRYLRNVMGLWLLQECLRTWKAAGLQAELETLLHDAARVAPFTALVDPDDPVFLPPGDMPRRIGEACRRTGQIPPRSQAETVRCVLDSLALAYRRTLREAERLSGRSIDVVHVVGGGARNALLCQLTADACRLPVVAGPVEAAALGNVLVQARAVGAVTGGLPQLRALVRDTQDLHRYEPSGKESAWRAAETRVDRRRM